MLGVALVVLVELVVVLDDEDELPHAASSAPTPTASTAPRIHWNFINRTFLSYVDPSTLTPSRSGGPGPLLRTLANPAVGVQSC